MKRALVVVSKMDTGGAETMMMKYYRALDKSRYQLDFAVSTDEEGFYDAEIKRLGGRIIRVTKKSRNPIKAFTDIRHVVKENGYAAVIRNAENAMASLDLLAAKTAGKVRTVFRSTNSNTSGRSLKERVAHSVGRVILHACCDRMVAPSDVAADFMFGERSRRDGKVTILPNAIDFNAYKFDSSARVSVRERYGIADDVMLLGNIGRFAPQKNQRYCIDVLAELLRRNVNSRLMLVGKGDLLGELKDYAVACGVLDHVVFLPPTSDVSRLYAAFDVLVFPSFFEGMPNVLIEAQASGLKCLASDSVTEQARISSETVFLPIGEGSVSAWADACRPVALEDRVSTGEQILHTSFNMKTAVKLFEKVVFGDAESNPHAV
ncbi:glycosyltransferase [Bifidobacterium platyrrhinorum]|uniref:Glycosyltransferase n=1 Tax=Bifidobacterium platyrrhinorum TaxID=2661628 RepID=A0A6L9SRJ9_9BIFI|nr:glycosyltransferase [Bifidobacterium platyrrhinorum]NEG55140.1 glycosyltransferase [Bifidobacterium platyrrhinorum]